MLFVLVPLSPWGNLFRNNSEPGRLYLDLMILFTEIIVPVIPLVIMITVMLLFVEFFYGGMPVSIPIFSTLVYAYEYLLLWQSYDDNTLVQRLQRYIASTIEKTWILLGRLWNLFGKKLGLLATRNVLGNEIEV